MDSRKAALFNQVLKTVDPAAAGVALDAEVPDAEGETPEIEAFEVEALEVEPLEVEALSQRFKRWLPPRPPVKAAKPAAKGAKGKPKAKK